MRQNIGQFLSMHNFLSTSTDSQVALIFAESNAAPDAHTVHILFQFNIDTRLTNTKPYANIKNLSYFPDEEEVLIGLGAIFRIDTVEYSDFKQTWIAVLTLCSEDNFELKDLMKQTKDELIGGITSLGSWLVRQGEYEKAKNYLEQIQANPSISKYERINCYRALGDTASGRKEYDKALQNYEHMLELVIEINDQEKIGRVYKSIGEVHWFKKDLDLALAYEQKALDILLPMNHRQLENVYAIIGNIYLDNDDCVSAMEYFEKSLEVAHQHGIHVNHPNFGVTYECIGVAYYKSSKYKHALEYYAKAMQVWEKSLPPSHPNFQVLIDKINITKAKMNEK
jgi:tetratricopeptide (TPR) repeat protein